MMHLEQKHNCLLDDHNRGLDQADTNQPATTGLMVEEKGQRATEDRSLRTMACHSVAIIKMSILIEVNLLLQRLF